MNGRLVLLAYLLLALASFSLGACGDSNSGSSAADSTAHSTPTFFILRTQDGGKMWSFKDIPGHGNGASITSLGAGSYLIVTTNVATGDMILSTDEGTTWTAQTGGAGGGGYFDISSGNGPDRFAEAICNEGYQRTTDNGATWKVIPTAFPCERINMYAYPTGYSISLTSVQTTTDGGLSWKDLPTNPTPGVGQLTDVDFSFVGPTLMVADGNGNVHRSNDNGAHWSTTNLDPRQFKLRLVSFENDGVNVNCFSASGHIYHSANSGDTWQDIYPTPYAINDVEEAGSVLFAVGELGTLLVSSDKGASWTARTVPTTRTLVAISFSDDSNGIIVGQY